LAEPDLVLLLVDHEEQVALVNDVAILEVDLRQRAADLGTKLHAIDGRVLAEKLQLRVQAALQRVADLDGWRRGGRSRSTRSPRPVDADDSERDRSCDSSAGGPLLGRRLPATADGVAGFRSFDVHEGFLTWSSRIGTNCSSRAGRRQEAFGGAKRVATASTAVAKALRADHGAPQYP